MESADRKELAPFGGMQSMSKARVPAFLNVSTVRQPRSGSGGGVSFGGS
jgi:hypothetical protein